MRFFQQKLQHLKLRSIYLPELFSVNYFKKFGLTNEQGDDLAFYANYYVEIKDYVCTRYNLRSMDEMTRSQFLSAIRVVQPAVVQYFSEERLSSYILDVEQFNSAENELSTIGGIVCPKAGEQICFIVKNGECYVAPKQSPSRVSNLLYDEDFGVNHSSLSQGGSVEYAGSLWYENIDGVGDGWVIDHETGHYGTRAYHINTAIKALKDLGMDLSKLFVRLVIPVDLMDPRGECDIKYEAADELYNRMERAQSPSLGA